jgi:hypothetical protein
MEYVRRLSLVVEENLDFVACAAHFSRESLEIPLPALTARKRNFFSPARNARGSPHTIRGWQQMRLSTAASPSARPPARPLVRRSLFAEFGKTTHCVSFEITSWVRRKLRGPATAPRLTATFDIHRGYMKPKGLGDRNRNKRAISAAKLHAT